MIGRRHLVYLTIPALLLSATGAVLGYNWYRNSEYHSHPCRELRELYREAKALEIKDRPNIQYGFKLAEKDCQAGVQHLNTALTQYKEQQEQFRRNLIELLEGLIQSTEELLPKTPTSTPK